MSETLVVGRFDEHAREDFRLSAKRAFADARFCTTVKEAPSMLHGSSPTAIFLDGAARGVEEFVDWVRAQAHLFSVPVVMLVPVPNDHAYNEAHAMGADDVLLGGDSGGITRRLANLRDFDPAYRPRQTQGRALLGYPDGGRRRVLGRVLRQGGFDVSFASDVEELERVAGQGEAPSLLVAKDDLPTGGAFGAVRAIRGRGMGDVPLVALAGSASAPGMRLEAEQVGSAVVGSDWAPPDHLLFLANELMRPGVKDIRASERMLFGAICAFRKAGELEPVYGLTYNISREGLYVRTLDPPVNGTEIWFEMRPPHSPRAVHLRGEAVWSKGLDMPGGAAPPGFGMRINEDACPPGDLRAYHEAYEAMRRAPIYFN